ncbi:MAG: MASE1 domain-containing protein [Prochlorothrix sp.]|nr:MASE1 domain-containing protein [Prochlorothrix sp.]
MFPVLPTSIPWFSTLILALAYWLAAQFSISFATLPEIASTPVWIGAGVAVGGIAVGRPGIVWGVFVSVWWLEYQYFEGWTLPGFFLALFVTIVVTLGKWGAARLIQCLAATPARAGSEVTQAGLTAVHSCLDRPKTVLRFVLWGAFLSHAPGGFLCASLICAFGRSPWSAFPTIGLTWWLSDAFGILMVTPLILAWSSPIRSTLLLFRRRWLEMIGLVLGVAFISLLAFTSRYPLEYMLMPLILWAAFRFRQPGATLLMVGGEIVALVGTAQGHGSFGRESLNESLLLIQSFIGVIGLTTLLVGAILHQNEVAEH